MKLSDGEKLIAIMLADLTQALNVSTEIDPVFVKEAIASGNLWSLKWQYHGLLDDQETNESVANETAEILTMCRILEYSIAELDDADRALIDERDRQVFVGFDGNGEPHYGVARIMIEEMDRFEEFKGRSPNSHSPMIEKYTRMKRAYDANGGAAESPLSLSHIQAILAA